jgi:hypothetical protein
MIVFMRVGSVLGPALFYFQILSAALLRQKVNQQMNVNEFTPPHAACTSVRPFRVLTAAELLQLPTDSARWLVEGLLPEVGTSLVGAPPKCCKSVFTRQLCAFVQMGHPFLGRQVNQGKTLYFSTQERAGPIVDHFRSLGCTEETMPAAIVGERFDPREALARLTQTVASMTDLKLVVLDMIGDFLPMKDTNDYSEMMRAFAPLRDLAIGHKLHLCVTTHTKKVQTENPVHAVIGSQAIAGAVDQVLILNNDSRQQRTITTVQRYGESLPLASLNWDSERRAVFLGQNAEELRAEQRKVTEEKIIKDLMLYVMGSPRRTREEILDAIKGDATTKRKAFNMLRDAGHIVQSGNGQKGDPYVYTIPDEPGQPAAQAA